MKPFGGLGYAGHTRRNGWLWCTAPNPGRRQRLLHLPFALVLNRPMPVISRYGAVYGVCNSLQCAAVARSIALRAVGSLA